MNLIEVMGHLGVDPEERVTPSGQKVTNFSVATNYKRGGKEVTVWFRITVWGDRFDRMMQYLKKGSAVIVVGELQPPEVYTDRNGTSQVRLQVTAEILKFPPFGRGSDREEFGQQSQGQQPAGGGQPQAFAAPQPAADPTSFGTADPVGAGYSSDDGLPF